MKGPDVRRNLQVKQDGIEGYDVADGDGWPTPLTDPSNPLTIKVTNSSSGSQKDFKAMSTSSKGELSLAEGKTVGQSGTVEQGDHSNKWRTSQQNDEEHSTPESEHNQ